MEEERNWSNEKVYGEDVEKTSNVILNDNPCMRTGGGYWTEWNVLGELGAAAMKEILMTIIYLLSSQYPNFCFSCSLLTLLENTEHRSGDKEYEVSANSALQRQDMKYNIK